MKTVLSFATLILILFTGAFSPAGAGSSADGIPSQLVPWKSWVLHGHEEDLCPGQYNDSSMTRCQWPSQLKLDISADGGQFEQQWLVFAESWAALPGGSLSWPESVTVDGRVVAVVSRNNLPVVQLSPGEHHIQGRFTWSSRPERIPVPPAVGLFHLTLDGRSVSAPVIDDQSQVWFQASHDEGLHEDELKVHIFRLIDDMVPMEVQIVIRLDVFGKAREVELADILLQGSTPMTMRSPLPARVHPNGKLTLQVRPGQWEIQLKTRLTGPQYRLNAGPCPYGDEIWSFRPHHSLRMVEVLDVPPVEPSQTEMPTMWRKFPAYLMTADSFMVLKEIRRGDPDPAPDQLALNRTWWLDFDGQGFTVHDEIAGTLSRQWYLAMNPPTILGRVVADGLERVISEQGLEKKMGVELRQGHLTLQADARIQDRSGLMSAVGWDHDFKSVAGKLYLPPGWRLLASRGIDRVSYEWLQSWSLLDFFLVLIIALAVIKLRGWPWGVVAFIAMMLIFHEPGSPRLVWLHILAVLALLPVLPDGWFKYLVRLWGIGAMVALLLIVIPFVVNQIRWGIYPQLAPSGGAYGSGFTPMQMDKVGSRTRAQFEPPVPMREATVMEEDRVSKRPVRPKSDSLTGLMGRAEQERFDMKQQDPDALIPTGPGLPNWQWQTIDLNWSGPVAKEQRIKFYLLSPVGNLIITFLRVGFLLLLLWILIDWRVLYSRLANRLGLSSALAIVFFSLVFIQPNAALAEQSSFPPQSLLDELRQRLLEKSDCYPDCADISRLEIVADENDLQVMLKVSSAEGVAVPLPIDHKSWVPEQVIMDYAPISGLAKDSKGQLWAMVPPGLHTIVLRSNAMNATVVRLPLPLKPHIATFSISGWRLEGIHADGTTESNIQLLRLQAQLKQQPEKGAEKGIDGLLPFLHIERSLQLGLTWHTTTTIKRVTDTGVPVVASVPLLAGESVTTEGVTVEQGMALINMASNQEVVTYQAVLTIAPTIELVAPKAVPWTETWLLDANTLWHCDLEGIPVIHQQAKAGQWQPQWQPWPGEKVIIHVYRPKAVAGQTKTIDQADLVMTPGKRFGYGKLSLALRTSQGGQHSLTLPADANLQQVTLNGRSLPIRQDGALVTVPLSPGEHHLVLEWHQLSPYSFFFKVPVVDLGQNAVNTRVTIQMPAQRWILMTWGPRWGPAVLFWSYFIAILIAAIILGRIQLTPIKTWQWMLLGLGLTQVPAIMALLVAGWLLVLAFRQKLTMPGHWLPFNTIQVGLVVWSGVALVSLFMAVQSGLTGMPDMQIAGNGSSQTALYWTQDHTEGLLPRPWALSLPIWAYHIMMFVWALWLAWTLLGWLKWAWHCLGKDGMWRNISFRKKAIKQASVE